MLETVPRAGVGWYPVGVAIIADSIDVVLHTP
jgi:hypothetical protein